MNAAVPAAAPRATSKTERLLEHSEDDRHRSGGERAIGPPFSSVVPAGGSSRL